MTIKLGNEKGAADTLSKLLSDVVAVPVPENVIKNVNVCFCGGSCSLTNNIFY